MTTIEYGQYSVVSYVNELRDERVNLGVLVWHPILGKAARFARNFNRVTALDPDASATRLRSELDEIKETWNSSLSEEASPLEILHSEFRHGLVVSTPLNARIHDPAFTLERIYSALLPREPFTRMARATQFANSFRTRMIPALKAEDYTIEGFDYQANETFKPVKVDIWYTTPLGSTVWRALSFGSIDRVDYQITHAKAIYADNSDLRSLHKYEGSTLALAVQMPKPQHRSDWDVCVDWLGRDSDKIEVFEDSQSIGAKLPQLVSA